MNIKILKITKWILIALLTLQFLAAGLSKITGGWAQKFEDWGYATEFAIVVGIVEVLLVVGLYIRKIRVYAIITLAVVMLGAMYTHLMAEEYPKILHNLILILLSTVLFWMHKRLQNEKERK